MSIDIKNTEGFKDIANEHDLQGYRIKTGKYEGKEWLSVAYTNPGWLDFVYKNQTSATHQKFFGILIEAVLNNTDRLVCNAGRYKGQLWKNVWAENPDHVKYIASRASGLTARFLYKLIDNEREKARLEAEGQVLVSSAVP